ncbi:MAG TPA: type II toxin-antitoxin system RelE/ParE family toxin [Cyclobacteriaceae bacterium]|nr:type II toxin-antitoxin system RelE/ParE family toxin [Cyclobacteriaceae bacterium]
MEEGKTAEVKLSAQFLFDLHDVYQYGLETFGPTQTEVYENEIWQLIGRLSYNYMVFPECRYLRTKSKMYRWIILDAHYIIYRIGKEEVQVLRILHSKRSISKIKATKKTKL